MKNENEIEELVENVLSAPPQPLPEIFADSDLMMGGAYEMAKEYLVGHSDRQLTPTWAIATENGQTLIVATPFVGENAKELVASSMRKLMKLIKAVRYTFTTEAWVAKVSEDEWRKDKRPPSERDDRVEVVLIAGADLSGSFAKSYEIHRNGETGAVEGLKSLSESPMRDFEGRFGNLLLAEDE